MPATSLRSVAVLAMAASLLSACHDRGNLAPPDVTSQIRAHVTGAAALALDKDGQFVLSPQRTWNRPELTADEAARIADVFVLRFVPTLPKRFERAHGAPIDFAALKRCGTPDYAESVYEEPDDKVEQGLVNAASSHWLFTFCDKGDPAVSVAVAAAATHLRTLGGDRFDPKSRAGGEFDAEGIPRHTTAPIRPEAAVARLAVESGRRIESVPRLVHPGLGYYSQSSRWLLELDSPVDSRGNAGNRRSERRFLVGRAFRTWSQELSRFAMETRGADTITGPNGEKRVFLRRREFSARWESVTVGDR